MKCTRYARKCTALVHMLRVRCTGWCWFCMALSWLISLAIIAFGKATHHGSLLLLAPLASGAITFVGGFFFPYFRQPRRI